MSSLFSYSYTVTEKLTFLLHHFWSGDSVKFCVWNNIILKSKNICKLCFRHITIKPEEPYRFCFLLFNFPWFPSSKQVVWTLDSCSVLFFSKGKKKVYSFLLHICMILSKHHIKNTYQSIENAHFRVATYGKKFYVIMLQTIMRISTWYLGSHIILIQKVSECRFKLTQKWLQTVIKAVSFVLP